MNRAPFKMTSARHATLMCDGKFISGGRASFVWQTFLQRRAAGVPGVYEISHRVSGKERRHRVDYTIEQAEQELAGWGVFGRRHVALMRKMRASRKERGLPVA